MQVCLKKQQKYAIIKAYLAYTLSRTITIIKEDMKMAMYEQLGYCPSNAFFLYEVQRKEDVSEFWKETQKLLGDRIHYMVYMTGKTVHEDLCNVVDALMFAKGNLGLTVAMFLKDMIPKCTYAETGRRIECTDIEHPTQIPWRMFRDGDKWKVVGSEPNSTMKLVEDDRYLVGIENTNDEVKLYLYRKK